MVKCQNCGHENELDANFCEKCGANLKSTLNTRNHPIDPDKTGMNTSTKLLIIACIILVAGLGLTAGALIQMNKVGTVPGTNNSSVSQSTNSTESNVPSSSAQYKSFNNGVIYFQYPSSWDVLPNTSNTMAIVGLPHYPSFSVYDESKYGYTSLSDYVSGSKTHMSSNGFSILSEQNKVVDGLHAYEIIYQGKSDNGKLIIQQMELVEKSPGSQYFVLVGADTTDNYYQDSESFNKIINSFKFL